MSTTWKRRSLLLALALVVGLVALTATGCEDDGIAADVDWVIDVSASPASHPIIADPAVGADSQILIYVYNENGQPQPGISVTCATSAGTLASGGQRLTETNSLGFTQDSLNTSSTAKVRCQSGSAFGEVDVTIGETNNRPAAAISILPQNEAKPGATVTFSGAQSSDLDGRIVEYRWSLLSTNPDPGRDNPEILTFGEGQDSFTRVFQNVQDLEVSLTVTDDLGAPSSPPAVENYRIVANLNPIADAGPGQTGFVTGTAPNLFCIATVSGCGSRDPDGTIVTYRWNWGDGRPEDFNSSSCQQDHTFQPASLPATYTVTLTVYDNGDGTCGPRGPSGDTCTTRGEATDTTTVSCPSPS